MNEDPHLCFSIWGTVYQAYVESILRCGILHMMYIISCLRWNRFDIQPVFGVHCIMCVLFVAVFKPDELRQALMPTLEKLYRQDPESLPFRQPVDPQTLGIPEYFEIVKKPMDLSTIKRKLDTGQYSDPWEYVDDVWLMFDNAWLYNRKTSKVYKYCSKVCQSI